MKTIRAKFKCNTVVDHKEYEQKIINLSPVTDDSEENKSFAKYTPAGSMDITISYETEASNFFEEGVEYFLDFSKTK